MQHSPVRVGLFGIGLDTYWPQFAGLKDRLEGYLGEAAAKLERPGVAIVNLGLVDSPEAAVEAGHRFRREDVDLIFLHVTTYALSSTVLPVVRRAKVPVIILNLAPEAAIDYATFNQMGDRTAMTGEWLAHCSACPVPEIANVFKRAKLPFAQITGMLHDDPECWDEVDAWIDAARVAHVRSRIGRVGAVVAHDPQHALRDDHIELLRARRVVLVEVVLFERRAVHRDPALHIAAGHPVAPDADDALDEVGRVGRHHADGLPHPRQGPGHGVARRDVGRRIGLRRRARLAMRSFARRTAVAASAA